MPKLAYIKALLYIEKLLLQKWIDAKLSLNISYVHI